MGLIHRGIVTSFFGVYVLEGRGDMGPNQTRPKHLRKGLTPWNDRTSNEDGVKWSEVRVSRCAASVRSHREIKWVLLRSLLLRCASICCSERLIRTASLSSPPSLLITTSTTTRTSLPHRPSLRLHGSNNSNSNDNPTRVWECRQGKHAEQTELVSKAMSARIVLLLLRVWQKTDGVQSRDSHACKFF